jgi:hypothetical protein
VTVPYGSKSCTLTKADEEKLRIFERRILRKIYGPTCENGAWRIKFSDEIYSHVKWVHCHHGMTCPRVADRGYGLQIWRVAANILNKQSRPADSGWSSCGGVGRGANNPSP